MTSPLKPMSNRWNPRCGIDIRDLKAVSNDIEQVLTGMHTTAAENSHLVRLKFTEKRIFFYSSYQRRSLLSVLTINLSLYETWKCIYAEMNLDESHIPELVRDLLQKADDKRSELKSKRATFTHKMNEKHRKRSRIQRREEEQEANKVRRLSTYKSRREKVLTPTAETRGGRSQATLRQKHAEGDSGVIKCGQGCSTPYYLLGGKHECFPCIRNCGAQLTTRTSRKHQCQGPVTASASSSSFSSSFPSSSSSS